MGIIVGTNTSVRYIAEATRGTTPTSPAMTTLRATGRNINKKKDTLESAEVSATRQRSDVRHGFERQEADFGFELSPETYSELLAYGMGQPFTAGQGASNTNRKGWWSPASLTGSTLSIASVTAATSTAAGKFDFVRGTGNWIDDGYRPGDYILSSGFADADNNSGGSSGAGQGAPDAWRVMAVTGTNMTVQIPAGFLGQSVAAGAAGNNVSYKGKKLIVGTTLITLTFERFFADVSNPVAQVFRGMAVNTINLQIRPEQIVGGSLGLIGMTSKIDDTAVISGSTTVNAKTNAPFSAFDGAVVFTAGNISSVGTLTGLDFTIDNQRSLFPVVGSKTSQDVYEGVMKITGNWALLLQSVEFNQIFQAEIPTVLSCRLNELGTTDFMSFAFYRAKPLSADIDPPQNGPVISQSGFEALETTFTGASVSYREVMHIQKSTTTDAAP